jgi:pseudouridine synthase
MYSEGLLILTNDGETAKKKMHPKNEIRKNNHETIKGEIKKKKKKKLEEPIEINGRLTTAAEVEIIEQKNGRAKLRIEIFEGRNRQIRRMCESCDLIIIKLKRVCVGELNIGFLKPGEFKYLNHNEITYLKNM